MKKEISSFVADTFFSFVQKYVKMHAARLKIKKKKRKKKKKKTWAAFLKTNLSPKNKLRSPEFKVQPLK